MAPPFDGFLLLSFGGPERPEDVVPFLENVCRGRSVPRERLLEVAEHYDLFDGVSPLNAQNRALLAAVTDELAGSGIRLPAYWGNRNWHPLLADTLRQMADEGVRHALALVTSAFASYSGCRQYLEDIERARGEVGAKAPQVSKLRLFFNHPGFIEPAVDRTAAALAELPPERRESVPLIFTAHSLPATMAAACRYQEQLGEACRLVAEGVGRSGWHLAYQSRSGPPGQPWLEPDVGDLVESLQSTAGRDAVVVVPIGFLSDHMEVVFDLDVELYARCQELGVHLGRAATVGCHPRFVTMVRELVQERLDPAAPRLSLGSLAAPPDTCAPDCCLNR